MPPELLTKRVLRDALQVVCCFVSVVAQSKARNSPKSARRLGRASLAVSIAGIIIVVALVVLAGSIYGIRHRQH